MTCKACNKVPTPQDREDCFEKALNILKQHYIFYKNALHQRDLELLKIKERNEKLNKALELLQNKSQQQLLPPSKRFKPSQQQHSNDSSLDNNSDCLASDISQIDDDSIGASHLNIALNSEQLFDTSVLSPDRNDVNITISSSEIVPSSRIKESPKRNKQRDDMRLLKESSNKEIARSKLEWHKMERNSPSEKSWATKFLKPSQKVSKAPEKYADLKKTDKRLCLSLKKSNPSKIKQSLIHFTKTKDESISEPDVGPEDIIEASPIISTKNLKHVRSWAHRSGQNCSSNNVSTVTNALTNVTITKDDSSKTLDDIVFDFSPTKKTDFTQNLPDEAKSKTKRIKFDDEISTDCIALPKEHLGTTNSKPDSSSVMILTPNTQDIIFVDDSCNEEVDIDTMDLMADVLKKCDTDKLENLKKYESKSIQKQQNKDIEVVKNSSTKPETAINIKQEKVTQVLQDQVIDKGKVKPSGSSNLVNVNKPQNPLLSSEDQNDEEEDEDFMPKPFIIKQDPDGCKTKEKLSIKERFNIECADCAKLIDFLDERLTDEQIKQHLDKCKHHNADIMRQNTPPDFWNPFILSFQADDPRNEVLIDTRFKDKKN